jgi:regulator of protease activity HflC (stomatin/prohibitin superfamily)
MVDVVGHRRVLGQWAGTLRRRAILLGIAAVVLVILDRACLARVETNAWGVEQRRFGFNTGIVERAYGPGLYFVGPGTTMHTFAREIHVLEATNDRLDSHGRASGPDGERKVEDYFSRREKILGRTTHRVIEALNVQTSDGYAVSADVTLLYSIAEPVRIAREFGWGTLYVDSFVINTFRNGILATLGKMNAESFYNEAVRIAALKEAERFIRQRFAERGFRVEKLLLRNYKYADNYEKSLHDKKVAVQLTVKNRKEGLVNEEKAKLKQIESRGNGLITIADSEVNARISKIRAEAELYASQVRAKADKEVSFAAAEAKRLKADALTQTGGRYVVALETAKMFDNIQAAAMTPEQYIAFIRSAWALIGVSSGSSEAAPSERRKR